ncbi:MAG: hypothetical protein ACOH18_00380 [Candidatus Saccharimonadaceae bacterium]
MNRRVLMSVRMVMGFAAVMVLVAGFLAPSVGAQASTPNTLKVSPVRTDVSIKAGETGIVPVTITNLTGNDILVAPIENDFVQGDENGTPSIILDADKYAPTHSLKRFMTPLGNVTVPANGSAVVNVKITVPANAQSGGYFGALRFAPTTPDSGGQVNLSASVASLILLTVPGPVTEQLNLSEFSVQQGTSKGTDFRSSNDLKVVFRFENKGNIQEGPFGKISVTQGSKVIYDYDFNQDTPREVVLPDGARKWEVPLKNIGDFGHYTVHATFTYGVKNESIDVTSSFWVIPMAYIIGAIIAVVLLIALIVWLIFFLKGRKRRAARRGARRRR